MAAFAALMACGDAEPPTKTHVVVRGDTLGKIAVVHDVTVKQLMEWNGLESDRIEVGQALVMRTSPRPVAASTPRSRTAKSPKTGSRPDAMRAPKAKPCLDGPALDDLDNDDVDIRGSMGLDVAQLRSAMRPAMDRVGLCIDGPWPSATIDTRITVGCNGVVSIVSIVDPGGADDSVLNCIKRAVRAQAFPAHDMPDGYTFRYPFTLSP